MPPSVSRALAERISRFRYRDLPPDVVAHAKLYLLDTIGAMLAAAAPRYPASRIMMRFVRELGGTRESTLVGQGVRTSCVDAALANGTLAYYCDIEPLHVGAILHALAVVVPTSLAVAEREESDGRRFLASVVLGVEVATRVSYAFDPVALYDRGFHPSAVAGVFGAAAAAGYLFRLSPERQAVALGLAMQQASGLLAWANDPTEHSRPFNPGLAARNGMTAACLARLGFGGPPTPFEGKYDAFTAFSGSANPDALADGWGERFHLPDYAYKLYSSCAFTHPGLDALLGLARDEQAHRRSGRADRPALSEERRAHDRRQPPQVALRAVHPAGGPRLRARRHRRHPVRPDAPSGGRAPSPRHDVRPRTPSSTRAILRDTRRSSSCRSQDGRTLTRRVEHARGTRENPLTADEVRDKYARLTAPVVPRARSEAIRLAVDGIDRAPGLARLAGLLRQKVGIRTRD